MALTAKMKAFARAVVDGMSNKDAAISAGYSEKTAMQQGAKLAKLPEVIAYIAKLRDNKKLTSEDEKLTSLKQKPSSCGQVEKVEKIESSAEQAYGQFVGRDEIAIGSKDDPLEYLKSVWTNECEDQELRLAAARAALPYVHGKVADKGKKLTKAEDAKAAAKAGGKFGTLGSQLRS